MSRAIRIAVLALLVLNLCVTPLAPPPSGIPLCYENPTPVPWGWRLPGQVQVTAEAHQLVDLEAPAGRKRFVLLGGSAVSGVVLHPERSLPAHLQRRLLGRGLDAEVVNLGFPGYDSGHLTEAALRSLEEFRPTAVLVYSGNNEFLRIRGYRGLFPNWSPRVERVRLVLEMVPLYRVLRSLLAGDPGPGQDWDFPLVDRRLPGATQADRELARDHYRSNLEFLVQACRSRGVPVVLCTVATNDLAEAPGVPEFAAGMRALEARDYATARALLEKAKELDPDARRAKPSLLAVVRSMAGRDGVLVCDVDGRLRSRAPHRILGHDLFADYCHFSPRGVEAVADVLEEFLEESLLIPPAALQAGPPPEGADEVPGLGPGPRAGEEEEWEDLPRLEAEVEAALRANPRQEQLWLKLARLRRLQGELAGALEALRSYEPSDPASPEARKARRDEDLLARALASGSPARLAQEPDPPAGLP